MNLSTLNSGALNGSAASLFVVAATAAITAACSISAAATRVQDALAPTSSGAQISAAPFVTQFGDTAITGTAQAFFTPTHIKQAYASGTATATITAFVTRTVDASAFVNTTGNLLAIPASTLGQSAVAGSAAVTANATRVQPGRANLPTSAVVSIGASARVTRFVSAGIFGESPLKFPETTINGVHETYCALGGYAQITIANAGILRRAASSAVVATATTSANGTQIKPGLAQPMGVSLVVIADPFLSITPGVVITASASGTATATRVPQAQALINATCSSSAAPNMRIGSVAPVFNGTASLAANATRTQPGAVNFVPMTGGMTATGTRVLVPVAPVVAGGTLINAAISVIHAAGGNTSGAVDVVVNAVRVLQLEAATSGTASTTVDAVRVLTPEAAFAGEADVTADALRIVQPEAEPEGAAAIAADAKRTTGGLANIDCQVTLSVRAVGNLDSEDPLERTFFKPAYTNIFTRTAQITEFRRAA